MRASVPADVATVRRPNQHFVAIRLPARTDAARLLRMLLPIYIAAGVSFVLATVMTLAAAGDVRRMRLGMTRGRPRLARHLWRMCFALFIAAGSFFSIRERVAAILPEPFTTGPMRALPILLLFGAMFPLICRHAARMSQSSLTPGQLLGNVRAVPTESTTRYVHHGLPAIVRRHI